LIEPHDHFGGDELDHRGRVVTDARALASADGAGSLLSVVTKMERSGIEKMEGPGNQKGSWGSSGWLKTSSTARR
jgi:hypothetical protein